MCALKSHSLAIYEHGATVHGYKIQKTPCPVALIYFSKSVLSEWFPKLCVRPLQNSALVLECSPAEERTHPRGALLLIVEGQLKSQLKSGSVWNAGLMRPVGGERERERRKDSKLEPSVLIWLFRCQGTCTVLLFVAGDGSKTQPNLRLDQTNTCGRSREYCLQIQ